MSKVRHFASGEISGCRWIVAIAVSLPVIRKVVSVFSVVSSVGVDFVHLVDGFVLRKARHKTISDVKGGMMNLLARSDLYHYLILLVMLG